MFQDRMLHCVGLSESEAWDRTWYFCSRPELYWTVGGYSHNVPNDARRIDCWANMYLRRWQPSASIIVIALMMEAVHASEKSVYYNETAWLYIQEGSHHHISHVLKNI
jgi:hypothetical protein